MTGRMNPTSANATALLPLELLHQLLGELIQAPDQDRPEAGVGPGVLSWGEFAAEVLTLYDASRARGTWTKMRQVLREVGTMPGVRSVRDLTPAGVAEYRRFCSSVGRATATTSGLLSYLRRAASYAVARGYLWSNPFSAWSDWGLGSEPVAEESEDSGPGLGSHHSLEAIARVLRHLELGSRTWEGMRLYALASLVAYTGLRRTEALTLRWRDVRLEERVIRISRRRRLKRPTAAAPVPIPEALVPILDQWSERSGSDWVFPRLDRQGPWTGGTSGRRPLDRLKSAGEAVGIRGFTFQSLRHSWATHAESAWGLSELVSMRVLRHTRPSTTAGYRHADLENLVGAVRSIDFGPSSVAS
jgi:integrase